MQKYIIIRADTNDGDYVTNKSKIDDDKLELLKPILEVIKSKNGRYETGEMGDVRDTYSNEELSDEQIDLFENYRPNGEYGIHTIESVEVLTVIEEVRLL